MAPSSRAGDESSEHASIPTTPQPGRQGTSGGRHDGFGESFESTGTVRRLPEASYGKSIAIGVWARLIDLLYLQAP